LPPTESGGGGPWHPLLVSTALSSSARYRWQSWRQFAPVITCGVPLCERRSPDGQLGPPICGHHQIPNTVQRLILVIQREPPPLTRCATAARLHEPPVCVLEQDDVTTSEPTLPLVPPMLPLLHVVMLSNVRPNHPASECPFDVPNRAVDRRTRRWWSRSQSRRTNTPRPRRPMTRSRSCSSLTAR
jgi:hypothetical protein